MRALVITVDGEVGLVAGVAPDAGFSRFFEDHHAWFEPHFQRMATLRAVKASMELVRQARGLVAAVARDERGARLLERLGFEHYSGDEYLWPDSLKA